MKYKGRNANNIFDLQTGEQVKHVKDGQLYDIRRKKDSTVVVRKRDWRSNDEQ